MSPEEIEARRRAAKRHPPNPAYGLYFGAGIGFYFGRRVPPERVAAPTAFG